MRTKVNYEWCIEHLEYAATDRTSMGEINIEHLDFSEKLNVLGWVNPTDNSKRLVLVRIEYTDSLGEHHRCWCYPNVVDGKYETDLPNFTDSFGEFLNMQPPKRLHAEFKSYLNTCC